MPWPWLVAVAGRRGWSPWLVHYHFFCFAHSVEHAVCLSLQRRLLENGAGVGVGVQDMSLICLGDIGASWGRLGVRLGRIRLGHIKLGDIGASWGRLGVKLGRIKLGHIKLGDIGASWGVRLGHIKLGHIKLGHSGEAGRHQPLKKTVLICLPLCCLCQGRSTLQQTGNEIGSICIQS